MSPDNSMSVVHMYMYSTCDQVRGGVGEGERKNLLKL